MKIEVSQIKKIYETTGAGVGPVDLHLHSGSFTAILGPSGCGKSTLLRLIAGIESSQEGKLERAGSPFDVSFVFQEAALLPWKTVYDNITLPLILRGTEEALLQSRAELWIEKLGLAAFQNIYPHELSGGLKMRVSLARALITDPKILLLDEPFAALDEPVRMELGLILRNIWQELKPTIILVTHSITEAVWLSERVLVMRGRPGKFIHDDLLDFPENRSLSVRGAPQFHRYVELYFNLLKGADHENAPSR